MLTNTVIGEINEAGFRVSEFEHVGFKVPECTHRFGCVCCVPFWHFDSVQFCRSSVFSGEGSREGRALTLSFILSILVYFPGTVHMIKYYCNYVKISPRASPLSLARCKLAA